MTDPSLPATVDVVVIGGGIWGSATAEALRRHHGVSVAILERRALSAATTSFAAALLPRARTTATLRAMVRETYASIAHLQEVLGEDLGLHRTGALHVSVSEDTRRGVREQADACAAEGDRVDWLTLEEARARVGWLQGEPGWDFAFFPEDGFIDPYRLGSAYGRAAKEEGASVHQGVTVTGLIREGDRITGVETDHGSVSCAMVVCAAGPWSGLVGLWAGAHLPLAPVRSHYWISAPDPVLFPRDQAMVFAPDARFYSRPEVGGLLYGFRDRVCVAADPRVYPADPHGFAFGHDDEGWESLREGLESFTPFWDRLGVVPVAHYIGAASGYTPDGKFVIGAWPGIDGFLAVTGCSGAGIATSGGVGRIAAALAAGEAPPWDVHAFRPDRFGDIDPTDPGFLQRCAEARANKRSG